jgi:glycosyltransferase involved in cell wall biosynthesis
MTTNDFPSLNILMDARMVFQNTHGIGRYVVNLVQELSELGQKVSILTNSTQTQEIIGASYIQTVIPCKKDFVSPLAPLDLSFALRGQKFDVVHFPSFDLPLVMPENSVVTLHDMIHLHKPAKPRNVLYYNSIVRHGLSRCRKVIAVSEWTKKEINKYLGTPLKKIEVVRNGLEEKWLGSSASTSGDNNLGAPYFLCLSNPKPHKNVITLIRACQQLWNKGRKFSLELSLGGEKIPDSWDLTQEHLKNIHLINQVSDETLMTYYGRALALVSPSLLEGYNYPVAEALALGCPAIVADTSANAEFRGGDIAFYRPPDAVEALGRLLEKALMEKSAGAGAFGKKNAERQEQSPQVTRSAVSSHSPHNIISRRQMTQETLAVYTMALQKS